jgi:catechol 2,3-dioxygenase-like lactoylglutathione lyase family enzyme
VLTFHHVNLGVPVGGIDAESDFLSDVLTFKRVSLGPDDPVTATWFESDDGKQVHLSEDPEHHPAARAHVAVELGADLAVVERTLKQIDYKHKVVDSKDRRIVLCKDPAGNRWELRGALPAG